MGRMLALLRQNFDRGTPHVTVKEVNSLLSTDNRRSRRLMDELAAFCSTVKLGPRGSLVSTASSYYHEQTAKNYRLKQEIAEKVAKMESLIPPGTSLSCSSGTTIAFCAAKLVESRSYLPILTNNIGIVEEAFTKHTNIKLTGGDYEQPIHACVGRDAENAFRNLKRKIAMIGVSGISRDGILFLHHGSEPSIREAMFDAATEAVLIVADISKCTHEDDLPFVALSDLCKRIPVTLITNPIEALKSDLQKAHARDVISNLRSITNMTVEFA
jgi:DeoR/GlpR family transcriptional regulator of sugar metabolism